MMTDLRARQFGSTALTALLSIACSAALAQPLYPWANDLEPRSNKSGLPFVYGSQYDPEKYRVCMQTPPDQRRINQSRQQCEEYREKIPIFDPSRRDLFAETFDLKRYGECKNGRPVNDTTCERYALHRRDHPEFWPYPEVPKPQWPDAPKAQTYQRGMSTEQYFKALCEKEAGVWVYRKVEGVKGIYVMRPRWPVGSEELRDRYVLEDPYGHEGEGPGTYISKPWGYDFVEFSAFPRMRFTEGTDKFVRYVVVPDGTPFGRYERLDKPDLDTRYGFTWRGIRRPMDRELGIAGGEMMVVDIKSGEVLALRRGFLHGGNNKWINWERRTACPIASHTGSPKDAAFTDWFLSQSLTRAPRSP